MDREKLERAAEESRIASAETLTTFGTHHYIDDVVAVTKMSLSYDEVAESAFIKGAEWLMQQPLSERLTDEEKEKLTPANRYILGTIFGADLFKEK